MPRFLFSILAFLPLFAYSQPRCEVCSYTVSDGLGSSKVSTIEQDKDGLIWIGSWRGLSYFDGYSFMNLYGQHGEQGFPVSSRIQALKAGANGGIWCLTYDRKLYFFNTKTCKYTNVSDVIDKKFEPTQIRNIYPLANGKTWIVSHDKPKKLYYISADLSSGTPFTGESVTEEYAKILGKKTVKVHNALLDEEGVEWIITESDTLRADGKPANRKPSVANQTSKIDSKGRLWQFSDDGSIRMTDKKAGIDKVFSTGHTPLYTVSDKPLFVEDSFHTVWVAYKNCVFSYFDEATGELKPYLINSWMPYNENYDHIEKHFIDNQNNIWVLGSHSLIRITPSYRHLHITDIVKNVEVRSLCVASDGKLLVGSSDGSLMTLDNSIPTEKQILKTENFDGRIYSIYNDSHGRCWIGTKGNGLYLVENGSIKHFTNDPDDKFSLMGNDVFDIFEDAQHHIWIACYDGGFNLVDEGTFTPEAYSTNIKFINSNNILPSTNELFKKVRHITSTKNGVIILSTADGIVAFNSVFDKPENIKFHLYGTNPNDSESLMGGNVMQTLVANDGTIYLSTMVGGLIKVKSGDLLKDNLKFEQVASTQQSAGIVLSFIEYTDGSLWLARENRIERFDPKTGETLVFGKKDFCEEVAFTESLPVLNKKDSTISMGVLGGVVTFNPKNLRKSDYMPQIVFSSVQYQGEMQKQPVLFTELLDVPSDKRNLTITFSALEYENNSLIRYAYKLADDKDWNYVNEGHSASFHNLPCGHIQLQVKSTNADGVWMDNVATLNIYSHPTFWETPWAKVLLVSIFSFIAYLVTYILKLIKRHKNERKELEERLEKLLTTLKEAENDQKHTQQLVQTGANETAVSAESQSTTTHNDSEKVSYKLKEIEIEPADKQFMTTLMAFMEENISNSALKVADMVDALGMSRSVFYHTLKNITGMSPVDFMKYLRIQRAKQMIVDTDLSFSEIAYKIGFSDPNYFGKSFKKSVGMSPSEYREKN